MPADRPSAAHKLVLPGSACWISIAGQVLDGPPGEVIRRLSTFLLIPAGYNRQGFEYRRRSASGALMENR